MNKFDQTESSDVMNTSEIYRRLELINCHGRTTCARRLLQRLLAHFKPAAIYHQWPGCSSKLAECVEYKRTFRNYTDN